MRTDWESGALIRFIIYCATKMDPLQLCKYLENRADEAEMREVIEWLDADPAHRRELDELDRVLWASALSGKSGAKRS